MSQTKSVAWAVGQATVEDNESKKAGVIVTLSGHMGDVSLLLSPEATEDMATALLIAAKNIRALIEVDQKAEV